ncbi:hypothetical protein B296_00026276 [Ensete ventricosum]|uniref:Uncharacterized protein n=1 Tax=Ensete ventricosum TaxID=4639 RepID=A0A426Z118_ENSVE|nr:hypothetical protein B296_00026276 [Ensete ventricosum]
MNYFASRSNDEIKDYLSRLYHIQAGLLRVTSIDITALDGIVNVNAILTLAIFVGLAWNPFSSGAGDEGLSPPNCVAGAQVEKDLVSFHVFAFASFLFSSLVALCLKQAVHLRRPHGRSARVNRALLRAGIVASAVGSVFGCGFLMLALVNVVQIKLGTLGCSGPTLGAVVPLVTLIPAAMLIYSAIVFYAFTRKPFRVLRFGSVSQVRAFTRYSLRSTSYKPPY